MIEKEDFYQADHCPLSRCYFRSLTCNQCNMRGEIGNYPRFSLTSRINYAIELKHGREER